MSDFVSYHLSSQGANAIIYLSYGAMLVSGVFIAWKFKDNSTFLSSNGTQKALPLSLNFIASAMGCGVLTTYAEIANISGLHGLLVYTISGAIPIFGFSFIGPIIRKKCPEGFVLTEWVFHRYGKITALYLSGFTMLTMFLFMIGELSAIQGAIESMTGINALPCIIIECVVTTAYTCIGGFKVSFMTDNIQATFVLLMVVICSCGYGAYVEIDTSKIGPSGLLKANKLGWQLVYILTVAIVTNDCFMSGFWLRTFASKSDKDLFWGTGIAAFVTFVICTLVGVPGFLAVWADELTISDPNGANAFFIMLSRMPGWIIAFVLIFAVSISTCTFDSLQSAMASTISNDIFRNKIKTIYVRGIVVLMIVPVIVVAYKVADDILQIYLIADLVSAAIIPVLFLGLSEKFYFLTGFDIMAGGLGALLSVFVFGCIYYDSAKEGGKLLLIWNGIYDSDDWGPFGAFVIAPVAGIIIAHGFVLVRAIIAFFLFKLTGKPFTVFDNPPLKDNGSDSFQQAIDNYGSLDEESAVSASGLKDFNVIESVVSKKNRPC